MPVKNPKAVIFGFLVSVLCLAGGCSTTEPENISERPWNAPKSWEHGMPGLMPRY
jgi:hypothetical protein